MICCPSAVHKWPFKRTYYSIFGKECLVVGSIICRPLRMYCLAPYTVPLGPFYRPSVMERVMQASVPSWREFSSTRKGNSSHFSSIPPLHLHTADLLEGTTAWSRAAGRWVRTTPLGRVARYSSPSVRERNAFAEVSQEVGKYHPIKLSEQPLIATFYYSNTLW